ncbi:MAG: hypothetical protein ABJA10_08440 [Aestuariivirga sp.]
MMTILTYLADWRTLIGAVCMLAFQVVFLLSAYYYMQRRGIKFWNDSHD